MRLFFVGISVLFWATPAHTLCINTDTANLRSGPSTNYPKSWEVYRFMPLVLVQTQGDWHQVQDMEGDKHWISKKLVSSNFKCATIKAAKANLRVGPGARYPQSSVYPTADKFEAFKVVRSEGAWVLLQDADGDKMWAHKDVLWMQ